MNQQGNQSLRFSKACFILSSATVVGKREKEGPLGEVFDVAYDDDLLGQENWEAAESQLQKEALKVALQKAGIDKNQLRYIFAGDLLGQTMASSYGLLEYQRPYFSIYGACSTLGEGLSLGAMTVAAGYANQVGVVTSSHFASAEKQFRFPLEYANQRPMCATWTVTGAGAYLLGNTPTELEITGITTGKMVDFGIKDTQNMGAAMAPAAADLIWNHFQDFHSKPEDYDAIITGDLGVVGKKILLDLLEKQNFDITKQHIDCGMLIYDDKEQHTGAGGSGCGCSGVVLAGVILQKLKKGIWKKVLVIPTGAMLSTVSFHEGKNVIGIAHGVVIEGGKGR